MKRYLLAILIALCGCATPPATSDQRFDGAEFSKDCHIALRMLNGNIPTNEITTARGFRCMFYVRGFLESVQVHEGAGLNTLACPPTNVGQNQAVAVVSKWLDDHPEKWNHIPALLTASALANAFPCTRAKQ